LAYFQSTFVTSLQTFFMLIRLGELGTRIAWLNFKLQSSAHRKLRDESRCAELDKRLCILNRWFMERTTLEVRPGYHEWSHISLRGTITNIMRPIIYEVHLECAQTKILPSGELSCELCEWLNRTLFLRNPICCNLMTVLWARWNDSL